MTTSGTEDRYFEQMWAQGDDPWEHGTRWYETRKYDLTVASLPEPRYRRAFEPACGAGFLTTRLAARCDEVVATERSARGATATAARCRDLANVQASAGQLPHDWPDGTFDLVVLSELLYYFDDVDLSQVLARTLASVDRGGHVVAVHYRRPVAAHVRSGDQAHEVVREQLGAPIASHIEEPFVLEVFQP